MELTREEKKNVGYRNSGYRNSGDWNSGDWNSGYWNSGYRNSGDWNSGDWNSGYWNSGDRNSGDRNSGDWNSGDRNSGDWNSGDRNSGYWNSGDWNSGNWNSGFLNSNTPKIRIFNKFTNLKKEEITFPSWFFFNLTSWVSDNEMSEQEKKENPYYETTKGFLKKIDYKEAWKKSFNEADINDLKLTLKLPNFDYKIFEEITGISKEDFDKRLK
jgi:hypothetical protein